LKHEKFVVEAIQLHKDLFVLDGLDGFPELVTAYCILQLPLCLFALRARQLKGGQFYADVLRNGCADRGSQHLTAQGLQRTLKSIFRLVAPPRLLLGKRKVHVDLFVLGNRLIQRLAPSHLQSLLKTMLRRLARLCLLSEGAQVGFDSPTYRICNHIADFLAPDFLACILQGELHLLSI